ncbi:glycosyltransferase [Anaeromyxobacter sp. PSR-1]|uniref:glycosyltransferase n=1 Tax=Anaeromyxobacter sp. PSR-1 TaxID=1300915 RepID=UPI001364AE62|nr:glycosyltransferase [Anaeromyxobacter sp. PSR-1]
MSHRGGGIPPVVRAFVREQRQTGVHALVVSARDPTVNSSGATGSASIELPAYGPLAFGFAPGVIAKLKDADLVHLHGLFTWPSFAVDAALRRGEARFLISPHGMLEPWALARSQWKKALFRGLVENRNLRRADVVHALCEAEARNIRRLGLARSVAVIPNGVDVPAVADESARAGSRRALEIDGRVLLFLGRIHPKKGLIPLIRAWSKVAPRRRDWTLVVAGPDQLGHRAEVEALAFSLGVANRVRFPGPLYGEAKQAALNAAEAFILPSFSEGFSMAVLEAMAARLPVVLTPECNFNVEAFGAGWVTTPEPDSLASTLDAMMGASAYELQTIGERGRREVVANYSWAHVSAKMVELYRWIAGGGTPPDSILFRAGV